MFCGQHSDFKATGSSVLDKFHNWIQAGAGGAGMLALSLIFFDLS